ncbi:MAG: pyridoxal-5-phosphate-dependent protein subunit beta, partial [Symbiobacteriaceae bacterium]|nr:pyridoxal-5-phosphate-dependent protein subunit beta [Symbiobacteriaceae bacterium]
SNVKEIFDKTKEIRATREDAYILNQFEEMGNYLWHYTLTGRAMEGAYHHYRKHQERFAGICLTSGSAGTLGSADYIKHIFPGVRLAVGEALQCPTILNNGFGSHRIEGIGDKHIPWIHNVRNTDMAIGVDDNAVMELLQLFNEEAGITYLREQVGLSPEKLALLPLLGISGIANLLCCLKFAKYYELSENDMVFTVLTDSMEMYGSRLEELRKEAPFDTHRAAVVFTTHLRGCDTENMLELTMKERRRVHNLKYYTWVEQQGKSVEELNLLWDNPEETFGKVQQQSALIDKLIQDFNQATGVTITKEVATS